MDLSIIVPIFNEKENIEDLIEEIYQSIDSFIKFEVVIIDDASDDNSLQLLKSLKEEYSSLRIIRHEENYGQSSAIRTGVSVANAKWIATIDGDGQNDPRDITKLYKNLIELNQNGINTMIAGFRKVRNDNFLKRFSSRYANKIRSMILKDNVPDTGCGLKLFSRKIFLELPFFDHYHRYLPALFISNGGQVVSIEVNHRQRIKGSSKYGFHNRFWVGIYDLIGVKWLVDRKKIILSKEY